MLPEVIRLLSPAITDICFQDNFALRNSKREVVCTTAQLGLSLGDVRLQEATRGQSRVTHRALPLTRPVTLYTNSTILKPGYNLVNSARKISATQDDRA